MLSFRAAGARNACRPKQPKKGPWRSLGFGPSNQIGAQPRSLPGADGHIWDRMGFDGRQRIIKDILWSDADLPPQSAVRSRKPFARQASEHCQTDETREFLREIGARVTES